MGTFLFFSCLCIYLISLSATFIVSASSLSLTFETVAWQGGYSASGGFYVDALNLLTYVVDGGAWDQFLVYVNAQTSVQTGKYTLPKGVYVNAMTLVGEYLVFQDTHDAPYQAYWMNLSSHTLWGPFAFPTAYTPNPSCFVATLDDHTVLFFGGAPDQYLGMQFITAGVNQGQVAYKAFNFSVANFYPNIWNFKHALGVSSPSGQIVLCDQYSHQFGIFTAPPDILQGNFSLTVGPPTTQGVCTSQTDWVPSANAFLSLDSSDGTLQFWKIDSQANVQTIKVLTLKIPNVKVTGWHCLAVDDVGHYAFVVYELLSGPNFGDPVYPAVATFSYASNNDLTFLSNVILNDSPANYPSCLGQPAVTSSTKYQQFTWGTTQTLNQPAHIAKYK